MRKRPKWTLTVRTHGHVLVAQVVVHTPRGMRRKVFRYVIDLRKLRRMFLDRYRGQVSGWSLKKMWRKVKKGARKVASSKVWAAAEKATKYGAALPPPYGPALQAAHTSMSTTRALVVAEKKIKQGDKAGARKLVQAAKRAAAKEKLPLPGVPPKARKQLYLALV